MQFSVVMAVYEKDDSEWLKMAIESILSQSVRSDDIVIVVDGPLSATLEVTLGYYEVEKSISIIRLKKNKGLGNALNIGINRARNELIARMDADDIAILNRFELQLAEFKKNPNLSILGGQVAEFIDNPDEIIAYRKVPMDSIAIKEFSRRRNPFNHPTVMYRKSVINRLGGYDMSAIRIEDYDLWLRIIHSGAEVGNLDQVLLNYRSNENAMKRRKTFNSLRSHIGARYRFYLNGYISKSDLIYGIVTQTALFVLPTSAAKVVFNKMVRK